MAQSLHDVLNSLWNKDVYLETDNQQFKGKLVYVSKKGTFASIEDVLHGKQRVPLTAIQQVWFRNRCLWKQSQKALG